MNPYKLRVYDFGPGLPPVAPPPAVLPPAPRDENQPLASVRMRQLTVEVGAEPQAVLSEKIGRQYLLIQNATGSGVIYVGFSLSANANTGIEIIAGGSYELRSPAPSNEVSIVCPTGTATVRIVEG